MSIRNFQESDIEPLTRILQESGMFRKEEIDVAVELMHFVFEEPEQKDYSMRTFVDEAGTVRGYYCAGPTPMTTGTFDLYWIAVDASQQRKGVGAQLLRDCEEHIRSLGGRLIIIETSSQQKYDSTRLFYERQKFTRAACIKDFYSTGDDLMIYTKHLKEN